MWKPNTVRITFIVLYLLCAFYLFGTAAKAYQSKEYYDREQQRQTAIEGERIGELARRIDEINSEKLDVRMTKLETVSENNHDMLIACLGGLGLLVLESAYRLFFGARRRETPTPLGSKGWSVADSYLRPPQGIEIKAHDNGDGTFSISTHDISGGSGVADTTIEIQGYRMLAHDNGDGTFSITTTATTGSSDQTIEWEGLRLKIHPTGENIVVDGISVPTYAFVVNAI
jgi:hypothetical protein